MKEILAGKLPTSVFKALLATDPSLTPQGLARLFIEEFENVDSVVVQAIWQWAAPGRSRPGIEDERMNAILLHHLKEAGYL